jgi:hypothetical protein
MEQKMNMRFGTKEIMNLYREGLLKSRLSRLVKEKRCTNIENHA